MKTERELPNGRWLASDDMNAQRPTEYWVLNEDGDAICKVPTTIATGKPADQMDEILTAIVNGYEDGYGKGQITGHQMGKALQLKEIHQVLGVDRIAAAIEGIAENGLYTYHKL